MRLEVQDGGEGLSRRVAGSGVEVEVVDSCVVVDVEEGEFDELM